MSIALYPAQTSINVEDTVMRIGVRGEEEGSVGNFLDASQATQRDLS